MPDIMTTDASGRPITVTISADPVGRPKKSICAIGGCGQFARARGLCNAHYLRLRRAIRRQQREAASGGTS